MMMKITIDNHYDLLLDAEDLKPKSKISSLFILVKDISRIL